MLTDFQVKNIPNPDKRREVPDGKVGGLYLVIQPSGARSWALRYRVDGKPKKLTIGSYGATGLAAARRRAQEALGEIAKGGDPAATKRAARDARKAEQMASNRVADVAVDFVEKYVKRNVGESWGRETERLLKAEIIPKFGTRRLSEIGRSDVHDLLDGMIVRGAPINANRTLAVFRKLCNWAIERGIILTSPCDKIRAPSTENARDRVLSDDEIRLAWRAFESVGWPHGQIAQLLLLTGARLNEIASGRWGEVDLDRQTWTFAKERSKNGVAHEIPLSDPAIGILQALPRVANQRTFIFTTNGRTPVSSWGRAKSQIDLTIFDLLRAEAEARGGHLAKVGMPPHWVFHDLRRTAASGMAGMGIAPHVVEAVLNHKSETIKGVAAVYNRYTYAAEKRQALEAWARRLEAIVSGEAFSNAGELASHR
jgi:integrase